MRQLRWVIVWGALINVILSILKVIYGWWGNSHALLADGVHSFSDVLVDLMIYFAAVYGAQGADSNHPYGHQRIETAATLFLAVMMILVAGGIMWDAIRHLLYHERTLPTFSTWIIALISVIANELLYRYTLWYGRRLKSNLLEANAWHHRSDAASSLVVVFGIGMSLFGYSYLDPVAALIVAMLIIKMGWQLAWSSMRELVDTGVDDEVLKQIRQVIERVPGVSALHQLRTRSMAGLILADVHIIVSPKLSVSEGHHIGQLVHKTLKKTFPDMSDVVIHIDPEDDESTSPSSDLPPRAELEPQLRALWKGLPASEDIQEIIIHYLAGKTQLEVCLPVEYAVNKTDQEINELQKIYEKALIEISYIKSLQLVFTCRV